MIKLVRNVWLMGLLMQAMALHAQTYQWEWAAHGGGTDNLRPSGSSYLVYERITHIDTDAQGNIYYTAIFTGGNPSVLGNNQLDHNETQDVVLFSTDCQGNFRWKKEFGNEFEVEPTGLAVTPNGEVYASGQMYPRFNPSSASVCYFDTDYVYPDNGLGINDPGPHNNFAYLIKYDSMGNFQWLEFPQNGNQTLQEAAQFQNRDVQVASDGTLHWLVRIGPGTHVDGNITVAAGTDPLPWYVLRYDASGSYLGSTPIPLGSLVFEQDMDFAYDETSNRYLLAVNRNNDDLVFNGTTSPNSCLLASIDAASGNVLWVVENNDPVNVGIMELVIGEDSTIFITGGASNSNGNDSFAGYQFDQTGSGGGFTSATFAMALNPDGSLIWGNNADVFSYPARGLDLNQNSVAVGWGFNTAATWDGVPGTSGGPNVEDPAVILLDRNDGSVQGIYQPEGTAGLRDEVTALGVDGNGNFIVGGYMRGSLFVNSTTPATITKNGGNADFWFARLATTDCNGVPLSNAETQKTPLRLHPNPTSGLVAISGMQPVIEAVVYDTLGREVNR